MTPGMSDAPPPLPPKEPSTPPPLDVVDYATPEEEGLGQKRAKRTFWQKLGGEGFMVSVAIHVILVIIAAFLIISVTKESAKKDPDSFSTGAGGGAAGEGSLRRGVSDLPGNCKRPTHLLHLAAAQTKPCAAVFPRKYVQLRGCTMSTVRIFASKSGSRFSR